MRQVVFLFYVLKNKENYAILTKAQEWRNNNRKRQNI